MIEILKYAIPAFCVLLATWITMHKFYKSEADKRLWELKRLSQKEISPLRMRAYERLALLLERTTPEHMLIDLNLAEMTPLQVQAHLMHTIRQEYDHNLSQQVYVSEQAWEVVKNAKESIVQLINACAAQVDPQGPSSDLANAILTTYQNSNAAPTMVAISCLKTELKTYFSV